MPAAGASPRFFTRPHLCAASFGRQHVHPEIRSRSTVVDWSAVLLSSLLGMATYGLYYLVDRLRKTP